MVATANDAPSLLTFHAGMFANNNTFTLLADAALNINVTSNAVNVTPITSFTFTSD